MKILITLSMIITSLTALATNSIENTQWLKVADGTSAYCANKADAFKNRLQAYKLAKRQLSVTGDALNFSAEIVFFQCQEVEKSFQFVPVDPFESYSFKNIFLPEMDQVVDVNTENIKLIVYRDGVYKSLHNEQLESSSKVDKITFPIAELLTVDEMILLDEGKSVKVSFDLMLNRKIETAHKGKTRAQIIRYGSFRQWLTLKKIDEKILVE